MTPLPSRSAGGVRLALGLATLLPTLGISIATVALPELARTLESDLAGGQWVVLAYLLASTTLSLVAGRLGDLWGRKRVLQAGIALFGLGALAGALAPSIGWLLLSRALQGAGAAAMLTLALALAADTSGGTRTGRTLGLLGTMSALGTALGPSLGGILITLGGWRGVFVAMALPAALAWLWVRRDVPSAARTPQLGRRQLDLPGAAVLVATLGSLALAATLVGDPGGGGARLALLAVAAAGATLFVRIESRAAAPLLDLALLRVPGLRDGCISHAAVASVMMTTLVVGPFYLTHGLGLDALATGLVMSVGPLSTALAGVPAGRAVDRFGPQRSRVAGLVGVLAGAASLAALPAPGSLPGYVAPLVCMTSGYALFMAANTAAVLLGMPAGQRGVVSGLLNLSRNLGLMAGAALMGTVFALATGGGAGSGVPAAPGAGLRAAFALGTVCLLAALWLSSRPPGATAPDAG